MGTFYLLYNTSSYLGQTGPCILGPFIGKAQVDAFCGVLPEYARVVGRRFDEFVPVAWVERCPWSNEATEVELGSSPWLDVFVPNVESHLEKAKQKVVEEEANDRVGRCYGRIKDGVWINDNLEHARSEVVLWIMRLRAAEKVAAALLETGVPGLEEQQAWWAGRAERERQQAESAERAGEVLKEARDLAKHIKLFD